MAHSSFRLREFQKPDFDAIWRIDQVCFVRGIAYSQPELGFYITRSNAFTIVAESAAPARIVGFIVAQHVRPSKTRADHTGHIITIDVLPETQRSGLGTQLLRAAEERLRQAGCRRVLLETAVDNAGAIAFYQRHGYSIARTLPRYYNGELDALRMEKQLLASDSPPATR